MRLSLEVVTCSYQWSISVFSDGHNGKSTDDYGGERGSCRLIRGGVLVGYKGIVLCFP